ncbi:MAG: cation-transporting P-type ATPase [Firmicutes bacterium]|nr:cation-transporting P-type ATPase [Bacillota bacterium]
MNNHFYNMKVEDVSSKFKTNLETGLTEQEAEKRQQEYGDNKLEKHSGISPWVLLINQFRNIIVILLLVATAISLFMGDIVEAIAVFSVIIINALFGFFTEYRAEQAMDALKKMVSTSAKVIRNGQLSEIPAEKLVPGDIVVLEEGDSVPADARVVQSDNLGVIEASLTGESESVDKNTTPLQEETLAVGDRTNMVYMSTVVVRGNGRALITGTGGNTEIGKVSNMLEEAEDEDTPLEKRMARLGHQLAGISIALAVIMIVVGILVGRPLVEMLETSIALAIAAVPEGLVAVATITLAIGMNRMAKKNAIIRKLPAVETLGSTTVICSDKTGTLTENEMTLEEIWLNGRNIKVTGVGYQPEGDFLENNNKVNPKEAGLNKLLLCGALCNNAVVNRGEEDEWEVIGDPTEGALVVAARKMGFIRQQAQEKGYKELKEIPFSSAEKRMAIYYKMPDDSSDVLVKGSPAVILESCSHYLNEDHVSPLDDIFKQKTIRANKELAGKGLRVLALAYKPVQSTDEDPYSDLILLGLVGIMDPPRQEAKDAIDNAEKAGIRTIMITGDQKETAQSIAQRLGLDSDDVLTGNELHKLSKAELADEVGHVDIFARVNPKDKLDIVEELQKKGQIVAMTGDGVNDAPALKKADIGVSMGKSGTVVAKEASDMVLTDDNFATIIKAVQGGRVIFENINKFIHYLFSCNISEIIVIFFALLIGVPLPLVALQILWLNLVTDVFPALSLGWEPGDRNVMDKPPRDPDRAILTNRFKLRILVQGAVLAAATLGAYLYMLNTTGDIGVARSVAFLTLALVQLWHAFNVHGDGIIEFNRTLFNNKMLMGAVVLVLALQALAIYTPFLNRILQTVPLNAGTLVFALLISFVPIIIIQIMNRLNFLREEPS